MTAISSEDKANYLQILAHLNKEHAKIFTQRDLADCLGVSVRKLIDFKQGKAIDFWLLIQYAAIIEMKLGFFLMNE